MCGRRSQSRRGDGRGRKKIQPWINVVVFITLITRCQPCIHFCFLAHFDRLTLTTGACNGAVDFSLDPRDIVPLVIGRLSTSKAEIWFFKISVFWETGSIFFLETGVNFKYRCFEVSKTLQVLSTGCLKFFLTCNAQSTRQLAHDICNAIQR